jgi:hypothetical protein
VPELDVDGAGVTAAGAESGVEFGVEFGVAEPAFAAFDCPDESETTLLDAPQAERAKDKATMRIEPKAGRRLEQVTSSLPHNY